MNKIFPLFGSLKNYKRGDFRRDLFAGITVGVLLIPQGMAYSLLAGLPPIYGLYASTLPIIIYALLGTSRQLSVGPMAMISLLVLSGVSQLESSGPEEYLQYTILLALMVGIMQTLMGFLKLGFLVNFLSRPVITGFNNAAAIIIALSQMKHLLAIELPRGKTHELFIGIFENFQDIHLPSFVMGLVAIILLYSLKKINKQIPGPLIVVFLGIMLVYLGGWDEKGILIIKDIPEGLPFIVLPKFNLESIEALLPTAAVISIIGFMQSIAVAKAIQDRHRNYEITPNRELIALGFSNIGAALFSSFPVSGGMSRSAVNDDAGAQTGIASIIAAILVLLTLQFFTTYFYYLPYTILAALIMVSVIGMVNIKEGRELWRTNRVDFFLFIVTALATLFWGIEQGILLGIGLSLIMVFYNVSYPHVAELGWVPGTKEYRNLKRFSNLETYEEVLIMRFDAPLYFANLNYFKEKLAKYLEKKPNAHHVILDFKPVNHIDSSAIYMMKDQIKVMGEKGIKLYFADVKGPVRDMLKSTGIMDMIGEDKIFLNVHKAIQRIQGNEEIHSHPYATQSFK
ncbi:MAG: solute carrier family 26 protein [Bacteroidia bacterium]|nr:solute carrier family 26 protein [Bacteroidia bacterium]